MVSYGNYLYVMGGFDNSYDLKNTVYYTETNTSGGISPWQSANNLAQPVFGHSSTCYNGIITILGGYVDTLGLANSVNYFAKN